jgi:hypothetical protein
VIQASALMKFWLGLGIGGALGALATYLALEQPWRSAARPTAEVAAVTTTQPIDAGVAPRKGKGRRTTRTTTAAGAVAGTVEREVDDDLVLSDADRALEWRGDAVSLPPRTLDLGAGDAEGRPLEDGEIQGTIVASSGPIIGCITTAAGGAPLSGTITLSMLVGGDGGVDKVRVRAPHYLHEHGLLACARGAARSLRFPSTGAPTVVTVPYELN